MCHTISQRGKDPEASPGTHGDGWHSVCSVGWIARDKFSTWRHWVQALQDSQVFSQDLKSQKQLNCCEQNKIENSYRRRY